MSKKRVVVVCPGRGSYTKESLGYLRNRNNIVNDLTQLNQWRKDWDEPSITALDEETEFKISLHTKGEHASPLIYSCSRADFLEINQDEFEIVAITGNSMGWYLALSFSEALDLKNSFQLIQTMGSMMKSGLIGGQIIYPIIDENWRHDSKSYALVIKTIEDINKKGGHELYISIRLGGYLVIAGNKVGLSELLKELPKIENYPFQLVNHAAFHTPMLDEISDQAFIALKDLEFRKPKIPLIDGRGHIWQSYSTSVKDLYRYTLGFQVTETYDFSKAITVALKEFCPDHLVLLGPGNSLGGAIGQIMIENRWFDFSNKEDFVNRQKTKPFLISMGLEAQRKLVKPIVRA
jgi:[acyl-carrier-protein] S-malonyltransferase